MLDALNLKYILDKTRRQKTSWNLIGVSFGTLSIGRNYATPIALCIEDRRVIELMAHSLMSK